MITSCVKGFFGIYFKGRGFITIWRGLFENILSVRLYDMAVGLCCMALLYFLRVSEKNIVLVLFIKVLYLDRN